MDNREFTLMVQFDRQFYPKPPATIESGTWGIITVRVDEIEIEGEMVDYHSIDFNHEETYTDENGNIHKHKPYEGYELQIHPDFGTITLKGTMCEIERGVPYKVHVEEVFDPKYNRWNYDICSIQELYRFENENQLRTFLGKVLTEKQVDGLFETFGTVDEIIDVLEHGNIEALQKVKGVGEKSANSIVEKYMTNKDFSKALVDLNDYGLTVNMVTKLSKHYGSPDILVEKVRENPYILSDEVDGIGFLKADALAMNAGFDPHSPKRCYAYILYYFSQQIQDGHSFVDNEDLVDSIRETLGVDFPIESIVTAFRTLVDKGLMWASPDQTSLALMKYYKVEQKVASNIFRLLNAENNFNFQDWESKIKQVEDNQGWSYTEEQIKAIEATLKHNVVLITGLAGCVDMDTEYFNGHEWKKISEYRYGEKVLQYNPDGTTALVAPQRYIKESQDTLYHIQSKYGIDQCLSLDHDVAYITSKGNLIKRPLSHVKDLHEGNLNGFSGRFITTFNYSGSGIDLDESDIRLMVAVFADGNFDRSGNRCSINIKKQRKKDRLELLLNNANIPYSKRESVEEGYHVYTFQAPFRAKHYPSDWYNCSKEQFQVIIDEIVHWDGCIDKGTPRFYTASKTCADFIQFALSCCGYRATIYSHDRTGEEYMTNDKVYVRKSKEYSVVTTKRTLVGIGGFHKDNPNRPQFREFKTKDGYQYCFTVPSGFLVLRRNDRIFITGNCGKTASVAGMLAVLQGYSFAQCALSGKASVNMMHVTGEEGYTIHRLLGYNPRNGYKYNEDNKLPYDIIILDELSMVDAELFSRLVEAIPDGSKLIMLGDTGQLTNIGCGNIMFDMLDSGTIPSAQLTKVQRQGAKSAIITKSINVRHGVHIVDAGSYDRMVLGELEDLEIIPYKEYSDLEVGADRKSVHLIVDEYLRLRKQVPNVMDISVLLPTNSRGTSTYKLNQLIQAHEIKYKKGLNTRPLELGLGGNQPYKLHVGDKVINMKNNYESFYKEFIGEDENGCPVYNKQEREIYNGNMGIVTRIDHNAKEIEVDFERIGLVTIAEDDLDNIQLGYAISVHKSQGATIPYVIMGVDYTHFKMLCREILYTGITRAKNHCVLIGENRAIRKATNTTNVKFKQTFLPYFLSGQLPLEEEVEESLE